MNADSAPHAEQGRLLDEEGSAGSSSEVSDACGMLKTHGTTDARRRFLTLLIFTALASATVGATIACGGGEPGAGPVPTAVIPAPEILSLAPSTGNVHELVLSWKPIEGIDRFVLCETTPPSGTTCEERLGVSEATVTVPGPTADPQATGTWLKYLWLQSCGESQCSSPPTPAGAIAHRVVYGTPAWNFIVIARKLERGQVEVALSNASEGGPKVSTLIARTSSGSEIGRCEDVLQGRWCGPLQAGLLTNEIVAEQLYSVPIHGYVAATVELPVMPSTTAAEPTSEPIPKRP
jgi:hypothetical protein